MAKSLDWPSCAHRFSPRYAHRHAGATTWRGCGSEMSQDMVDNLCIRPANDFIDGVAAIDSRQSDSPPTSFLSWVVPESGRLEYADSNVPDYCRDQL
jgi:hypothetical protein